VTKNFATRNDRITLAQFGFIFIEVGNRGGNPQRSKCITTFGYGKPRDYGLADKKAAIEQTVAAASVYRYRPRRNLRHFGGGFIFPDDRRLL